jgi:predicted acylesterase/phospholipase RssA
MTRTTTTTGLVLSGGGAKGAYQVGVLKALRDMEVKIHMVSGASIGALNGGILASAPSFSTGVERVEQIWEDLAKKSPVMPDYTAYVCMLLSLLPSPLEHIAAEVAGKKDLALLSDSPLKKLMAKYLDLDGLETGLPFYVSAFKSQGVLQDIVHILLAEGKIKDTPPSEIFHVQGLPRKEWEETLLASAALPGIYPSRNVQGSGYTDGGTGGWKTMQGTTPVQPLIDAGCKRIIVTHLDDNTTWQRDNFPGVDIIEIRPKPGVFEGITDLLNFDAEKINQWSNQGEEDTWESCLQNGLMRHDTPSRRANKKKERHMTEEKPERMHPPRRQGPDETQAAPVFACRKAKFNLEKDLVLSEETRIQLEESLTKLRYHKTIYVDWGFSAVDPMGQGTILNFYGPPGTGKTMAAEALAGTLDLPIIHIGIAELESKFMGDTAKNIQSAFESSRQTGAILFFDEADTLLGKRLSSVTQGVDNEVNAMRSTLLIELERFEGIAIFATNFAKNYDEAFRSRITSHIKFTLPDLAARKRLWERMLVPDIPLAEERQGIIDWCGELSEGFSGREIRACMRLSLPKAILATGDAKTAKLTLDHLKAAIHQVLAAQKEVASPNSREQLRAAADAARTKKLLGIDSSQQGV